MTSVDVLVATRREDAGRFYKNLTAQTEFRVQMVFSLREAMDVLRDPAQHVDVLVLDSQIGQVFAFINDLRQTYPRLFIILVDEGADFAMPGQADEISTDPFNNQDLVRRIIRLMSDRQLETLRADSLPALRQFAKELRLAPAGEAGKHQAAVAACKHLGFDYVALYRLESLEPIRLALKAQDGPPDLQTSAPPEAHDDDILTWVVHKGQSRIAGPDESPGWPLVARDRMGAAACVPVVFGGSRFGALIACRRQPGSITQENVLMLELVAAQLAAALSKDIVS